MQRFDKIAEERMGLNKKLQLYQITGYLNNLDQRNELDYKNHYIKFLQILDFEKLFWKNFYAILVLAILNNNMCLYLID